MSESKAFLDLVITLDDNSRLSLTRTSGGLSIQCRRPTTENGAGWLLGGSAVLSGVEVASLLSALQQPTPARLPRRERRGGRLKPMPEPAIALEPA